MGTKHMGMGHHCWRPLPQTNFRESFTGKPIVSWFNLETCSNIIKAGATGQNTYDFLLVFYSEFGCISYRFCAIQSILCRNGLAGNCDL